MLYEFNRYRFRALRLVYSVHCLSCELRRYRLIVYRRESDDTREDALELSNVVVDAARDVVHHVLRHVEMLYRGFFLQYRDARLEVRRLYVRDESPFKSRLQTIFERRELARISIARDDDLLFRVVELVERVEKFFLRADLVLQELYIVNEQHVNRPIFLTERCRFADGN